MRKKLFGKGLAILLGVALLLSGSVAQQGFAMQFGQKGEGVSGSLDLTLSYSAMWRVESHDHNNRPLTYQNEDDGNRNFDEGLVSSLFKALGELELRKEMEGATIGFFGRGYALYDTNIENESNDHDSPVTNNNGRLFNGSISHPEGRGFTDKTEGIIGKDVDFLDAFLFSQLFQNTDNPMSVKLGYHVVNWGESTFIQHGLSSVMSPLDASKAALPGTEIKEIILPVNQTSASVAITPNISLSSYYQFDWKRVVAPPVGSYFSTTDFIGDGTENVLLPVAIVEGNLIQAGFPIAPGDLTGNVDLIPGTPVNIPFLALDRAPDIEPSDDGQWGVSFSWYAEALNETEFSFYYINYHRKLPDLYLTAGGGTYDTKYNPPGNVPPVEAMLEMAYTGFEVSRFGHKYFDDVKAAAIGWNTTLPKLDTAFSGEIAYHWDIPVQTKSLEQGLGELGGALMMGNMGQVIDLSSREDVITAQATFFQSLTFPALADDINVIAEIGAVFTPNLDDGEFYRGFSFYPGDQWSWGYRLMAGLTYYDAIGKLISPLTGTDFITTLNFGHDVDGISPIPAASFTGDTKSAGIKLEARWQNTAILALTYNVFWGGGTDDTLKDRDNVGITFKWLM